MTASEIQAAAKQRLAEVDTEIAKLQSERETLLRMLVTEVTKIEFVKPPMGPPVPGLPWTPTLPYVPWWSVEHPLTTHITFTSPPGVYG